MIRFFNVYKNYKGVNVLNGINLEIKQGEFFVIHGKNSSGKTTLLNLIAGYENVSSGEILVFDKNLDKFTKREQNEFRRSTAYVSALLDFDSDKTLEHYLLHILRVYGMPAECIENVPKLLNVLNLAHLKQKKVNELSHGEYQRLRIARALVKNPKLVLADEPTIHCDEENSRIIMELLIETHLKGVTIIIASTSHNIAESVSSARISTLEAGAVSFLDK